MGDNRLDIVVAESSQVHPSSPVWVHPTAAVMMTLRPALMMQHWWPCLSAGWTERKCEGEDRCVRNLAVSSRAICCLLGVHSVTGCRCPQPVHTPHCFPATMTLLCLQHILSVTAGLQSHLLTQGPCKSLQKRTLQPLAGAVDYWFSNRISTAIEIHRFNRTWLKCQNDISITDVGSVIIAYT